MMNDDNTKKAWKVTLLVQPESYQRTLRVEAPSEDEAITKGMALFMHNTKGWGIADITLHQTEEIKK